MWAGRLAQGSRSKIDCLLALSSQQLALWIHRWLCLCDCVPYKGWDMKLRSIQLTLHLRAPHHINIYCSGGGRSVTFFVVVFCLFVFRFLLLLFCLFTCLFVGILCVCLFFVVVVIGVCLFLVWGCCCFVCLFFVCLFVVVVFVCAFVFVFWCVFVCVFLPLSLLSRCCCLCLCGFLYIYFVFVLSSENSWSVQIEVPLGLKHPPSLINCRRFLGMVSPMKKWKKWRRKKKEKKIRVDHRRNQMSSWEDPGKADMSISSSIQLGIHRNHMVY